MNVKKRLIAAALVLLLLLLPTPSAFGDAIYPAPGEVQAGSYLDHLVATVAAGLSVTVMDGTLPDGVELYTEEGAEGLNVYLRGTPRFAGDYNVLLTVGESASLSCPFTVLPSIPSVSSTGSVSCFPNERVTIAVLASAGDGGSLSYQWYYSQNNDNSTGSVIGGENRSELNVVAGYTGTNYYYCVVTNTNNGRSVSVASQVISVSVAQDSVTDVSLNRLPDRLQYTVGETLEPFGLSLGVTHASGSVETVSSGFSVYPTQFTVPGTQTIRVDYEGYSVYFDVTVQEATEIIDGIGVLTLPNKTTYRVGDTLDPTGLSIRAYYHMSGESSFDPNRFRVVSSGLSCSPTVFSYTGSQTVEVRYGGQSCTFSVQVDPALPAEQPVSLAVKVMPNKTTYTVGETLDITGLVLRQITNRQNDQTIYSGFQCSPTQLNTVGHQLITVTYGSLSTSFSVTVTDVIPSPTLTPEPTAVLPSPTTLPSAQPLPDAAQTTRTGTHAAHQSSIARSLIAVILVTSLVALSVLGVYVYIQNRGGFDEVGERLRELLNRRGRK